MDTNNLTLQKIAIWNLKICQKLDIFSKKLLLPLAIFLKKCQVFGNFLTVKWQFSGGSGCVLFLEENYDFACQSYHCVYGDFFIFFISYSSISFNMNVCDTHFYSFSSIYLYLYIGHMKYWYYGFIWQMKKSVDLE